MKRSNFIGRLQTRALLAHKTIWATCMRTANMLKKISNSRFIGIREQLNVVSLQAI